MGHLALTQPGLAQNVITPDATLGGEASQVIPVPLLPTFDLIQGGALRGQNLFHSFEQFNIGEGGGAYFITPSTDTTNIFTRVTGNDPSQILGILGTIQSDLSPSAASLFLLNPNGIVFGPGASLDIGGSFVATTADAIQFGSQGNFSVTDTVAPTLLTINPSALWFTQAIPQGITNRSIAPAGTSSSGITLTGLLAAPNRSLLLVGGDITMDGGRIVGSGNRIELGGLATPGIVNFETKGQGFSLSFPEQVPRSNITLSNDGLVGLIGRNGGDIAIYANALLTTLGGRLVAGIEGAEDGGSIAINARDINFSGVGFEGTSSGIISQVAPEARGNAGEINIRTNSLSIRDGAAVSSTTFGIGNAGNITISANFVEVLGFSNIVQRLSSINSTSQLASQESVTTGRSGNISIDTDVLNVGGGARISTAAQSQGQGGNLTIVARESTDLIGSGILNFGAVSSGLGTQTTGSGNAGLISLETGQLTLQDGATINASTFGGAGSAGKIDIIADSIRLTGIRADQQFSSTIQSISGISPNSVPATGDAGSISITTRLLTVQDGGSIETSTYSPGRGGDLTITATETTNLVGSGTLASRVTSSGLFTQTTGSGNAGRLSLETGQLTLQNGATISASTFGGAGSAGSLKILADSIRLTGIRADRQIASTIQSISGISSDFVPATGDAGDVSITTRLLAVQDGGSIETSTYGPAQGGILSITAREATNLIGSGTFVSGVNSSGVGTQTFGSGNAGRLRLETGQLTLQDGATISASTFGGIGTGGDLEIITDSIRLTGIRADQQFASTIGSTSELSPASVPATGDAGNVSITTRLLTVQDGGLITTSTSGPGRSGDLTIRAREATNLIGSGTLASGVQSSGLSTQTAGTGNAGRLKLETGQLTLQDGATINASTFGGTGTGGNLEIITDSIRLMGIRADQQFASTIGSTSDLSLDFVPATGDAGNVSITTRLLTVQDGGSIQTSTSGSGRGGDLTITATEATNLIGSGSLAFGVASSRLSTETIGSGNAGRLSLETSQLTLQNGGSIDASTYGGSGSAGSLDIIADSILLTGVRSDQQFSSSIRSVSGISPNFVSATGNAGNISVTTRLLTLQDGSSIQTSTFGEGQGGDLTITASESVELVGTASLAFGLVGSNLFTGTFGEGNAGQLNLQADQVLLRDGAIISTRSENFGQAGDISLLANRLEMIDGTIETDAPFSQGGNINVNSAGNNPTGLILLRRDSDITTNSFGNGGNITLNSIIIAFDDSDILARSEDARGGNITLGPFFSDTLPIGAVSPTENNGRVDVSADGRLASGTITTADTSFIQNSLNQLPDVVTDPNTLIAGSCIALTIKSQGTFASTGSGGLPTRPGDAVVSVYPTGRVQSLP
jgi:filamentous hemagglutinin family protein